MSTFSAKAVQHSINQLLINTINDAEKMLLDLPRDGDRVEVITSSSREAESQQTSSLKPNKTTKDVVLDDVTQPPTPKVDEKKRRRPGPDEQEAPQTPPNRSVASPYTQAHTGAPTRAKETETTPSTVGNIIGSVIPNKAQIVPGTIQVSPLRQMEGVVIDLVVMIKMKSGGSRTVNMQIECPHFIPKRIRVDGVWHSIV